MNTTPQEQVYFGSVRFDINYEQKVFSENGNPSNTIAFRAFKDKFGLQHIYFDEQSKNVDRDWANGHPPAYRSVSIDLDPIVFNPLVRKTESIIARVNRAAAEAGSFSRMVNPFQRDLDEKIWPFRKVEGILYQINFDAGRMEEFEGEEKTISLKGLKRIEETMDLMLPYDLNTRSRAEIDPMWKELPDHIKWVLLPGLAIVDAEKTSKSLGIPAHFLPLDHPLPYVNVIERKIHEPLNRPPVVYIGPDAFVIDLNRQAFVLESNPAHTLPFSLLKKGSHATLVGFYDLETKQFRVGETHGTDFGTTVLKVTLPADALQPLVSDNLEYSKVLNLISYREDWNFLIKHQEHDKREKGVQVMVSLDGNTFFVDDVSWELVELRNKQNRIPLHKPDLQDKAPQHILIDRSTHLPLDPHTYAKDPKAFPVLLALPNSCALDPYGAAKYLDKPPGALYARYPLVMQSFANEIPLKDMLSQKEVERPAEISANKQDPLKKASSNDKKKAFRRKRQR